MGLHKNIWFMLLIPNIGRNDDPVPSTKYKSSFLPMLGINSINQIFLCRRLFPLTTLNKRQIYLQDFISSWIQHRYNLSIVLFVHILTTNAADLYEALTANLK